MKESAMTQPQTGPSLEHFKLMWDYIKFHLGLYLATPPAFVFVANAFKVAETPAFFRSWCIMTGCCFVSGVCTSWFMANRINRRWDENYPFDWEDDATNCCRRLVQHHLYWLALVIGFAGLGIALFTPSS
jgi:hypothetical protein